MAAKMMAIILVLTFGGQFLDKKLKMDFPILTLTGALLGSALAIYSMIKDLSR